MSDARRHLGPSLRPRHPDVFRGPRPGLEDKYDRAGDDPVDQHNPAPRPTGPSIARSSIPAAPMPNGTSRCTG